MGQDSVMSGRPPDMRSERPGRRLTPSRVMLALVFVALAYWLFASFVLPALRGERTLDGHTRSALCLAFAPNGGRLFSGGYDGKVIAWDLKTFEPQIILDLAPHPVDALAISPDGSLLAIASDFDVKVSDLGQTGGLSPDNIRGLVVDLRTGARVAELRSPLGHVMGLAFAPERSELYAADNRGLLTSWDTQKWVLKRQAPDNPTWSESFAMSPDGGLLAVATGEKVHLFDPDLRPVGPGLDRPRWKGWGLAFAPAGRQLAFAFQGNVRLADPKDGSVAHSLPAPEQVRAMAYSPDGRVVAGGSMTGNMLFGFSGRLRVWRTDSGDQLLSRGLSDVVTAVAFSPDGRHLAAADASGSILLIRAPR